MLNIISIKNSYVQNSIVIVKLMSSNISKWLFLTWKRPTELLSKMYIYSYQQQRKCFSKKYCIFALSIIINDPFINSKINIDSYRFKVIIFIITIYQIINHDCSFWDFNWLINSAIYSASSPLNAFVNFSFTHFSSASLRLLSWNKSLTFLELIQKITKL